MLYYVALLQSFLTKPFDKDRERGATAVEYGLFAALIAGAIVVLVATLGTNIAGWFQHVIDEVGIAP